MLMFHSCFLNMVYPIHIVNILFAHFFSQTFLLVIFHCRLSDSKCPQASRTLLGIVADLKILVISMVSILPDFLLVRRLV